MRGLGRLAMFRRDRRGRGGRLRWRVRGGTNGMGGCRRVVRVLLACRRVCLCRLSWCPCLSVGHPPIARRPPGGSRLGFGFECSGRSPPAVQVCLLGRRMFTRVGRSPFVFVSFIRCTPAFWAWGSTLVPECKTRPMQPGYVTCVDSVMGWSGDLRCDLPPTQGNDKDEDADEDGCVSVHSLSHNRLTMWSQSDGRHR